eukprot:TRINITY_DN7692_c0_g1_i1.p1 TRINITY_DN7692_c0_g1~~TRINITY_DN7692_c0_g1_i1.p1  ORF type:complete len:883 (+),score=251.56 TRINITY_DN7692_c0_g1_i1:139-2787(+)
MAPKKRALKEEPGEVTATVKVEAKEKNGKPVKKVKKEKNEEKDELRGEGEEDREVEPDMISTAMLVADNRHQVIAAASTRTQYTGRSMCVSTDGVVAVVGSNDRGDSDWVVFQDALADPFGEPVAPLTCIDASDKREEHGIRLNSVPGYMAAAIYEPQQAWQILAVSWGPVLATVSGTNCIPLAVLTASGRVGIVYCQRTSRKVEVKDRIDYLDLDPEDFATSISWRPTPFQKDAGGAKWGFLAIGTTQGRITTWRTRAPLGEVKTFQPKNLQRTQDPGTTSVVAMEWVTGTTPPFEDAIVVLGRDSSVVVYALEMGDNKYRMAVTHKLLSEVDLPPACAQIACVVQGGQLRVFFAQGTSLVGLALDEAGSVADRSTKIQTQHTSPIVSVMACVDWVATCAPDGKVLIHPVEGGNILDLGCDISDQAPPSAGFGIELYDTRPARPYALALAPTATTLLVLRVLSEREANVNKLRNSHHLIPVFPFSGALPKAQMQYIIRNVQCGKFGPAEAGLDVGGILSSVSALVHSIDLRHAFISEWYEAVQIPLDVYRERREAGASTPELLAYLRLASAILQQLSPWAQSPTPVTPDYVFPAKTPSSSLAVIRVEIVRCLTVASLRNLAQDPQAAAAMGEGDERTAALSGVHFLTGLAARAAGLWTPAYKDLEEHLPAAADKATRNRQKFMSITLKLTPDAGAPRVAEGVTWLVRDLTVARKVGIAFNAKKLQAPLTRIKLALDAVKKSCLAATDTQWILPQPADADVEDWEKMVDTDLAVRRPCQTPSCNAQVDVNIAARPLLTLCARKHVNQTCPLTLLPLSADAVGSRPVCMACGTSETQNSLRAAQAKEAFSWLARPTLTGCLMCGARLAADVESLASLAHEATG